MNGLHQNLRPQTSQVVHADSSEKNEGRKKLGTFRMGRRFTFRAFLLALPSA